MDELGALPQSTDRRLGDVLLSAGPRLRLTVTELVGLPTLTGARLIAGTGSAGHREIRRVSVQEVPLQDFIREDELVLTTGIGLSADVDAFVDFAIRVDEAGASGLAIAVGYHLSEIPDRVLGVANERGLPLIELPWDLRFSDVSDLVLDREIAWQHAHLSPDPPVHRA